MSFEEQKRLVDAIEDGRIVRVTEEYAKREGLMVIRRPEQSALDSPQAQQQMKLTPRLRGERKAYFDIDKYRRPLHDKNDIIASLVSNFNWIIGSKRKQLNLSRKQLAQEINVPEEDLKMIENGILTHSDYVLINKLETYLKISLRKDSLPKRESSESGEMFKKGVHKPKWVDSMNRGKSGTGAEELVASDIEIIDDSKDSQ